MGYCSIWPLFVKLMEDYKWGDFQKQNFLVDNLIAQDTIILNPFNCTNVGQLLLQGTPLLTVLTGTYVHWHAYKYIEKLYLICTCVF